ncbi:MAG: HEAT repeat domain-containing protein [Tychonema bourrellyi B0820]|uniref:PBS lyase n=1 Tax=Tychonema bourrellyi FEM_GT703 TaxID=2040638 RepID=A0A2G4EZR7_9CYAN|nr:HEAT repeat domain-containing protein [Tychonema bourrellyi]MDQ2099916.1 HEAT repeat domain-containing protein [Tychonema bourrellyi B0820]PHX54995.1 PBS lyase [Tychonema bourrellyi FEM_GT703]
MFNILEQAQVAADRQNWSELVQCLQQLPMKGHQPLEAQNLEKAVSLAIAVLEYGDFQDRWDVAKILPNLGNGAIAPLINLLEDEDADIEQQWFAARILGKFDRPEVIEALAKLVKNADEELSQIAAETLGNLGPTAVASLATLLLQADSRLFATEALAQIRRSETIAPLLSVVTDSQVGVRFTAIEALSSCHDSRIPPVLVAALKDPATAVRKEAVRALGVRAYLDEEFDLVNLLKPLLWDIRLEVCSEAVIAMGRLKTDAAAAILFELLRSATTPIQLQIETIRALSWMETATALEYLEKALIASNYHIHPTVCQEIVTVLGRWSKPELKSDAAKILINFIESNHPAVEDAGIKQSLALALGQLGDMRALDVLIQLLVNPDNSVRLHSLSALKQLGAGEMRPKLESLLKEDNLGLGLREGIAIALQEW